MKVVAGAILVVELWPQLPPEVLPLMKILERPPHPYELFVKAEMKRLLLVRAATTDQGLQVKVAVFLSD